MDPNQTAPKGAVLSGSTLFAKMIFLNHKQMTKQTTIIMIGVLRVNIFFITFSKHLLSEDNPCLAE